MGPMRAAARFARELAERGVLEQVEKVKVYLYGSLALTGVGHGTPGAVVYGLLGLDAEKMEMSATNAIATLATEGKLLLNGSHPITFSAMQDVVLEKEITLPEHANGMRCCAYDREGKELSNEVYFSIGGGAIRRIDEMEELPEPPPVVPYPFDSCAELLQHCKRENMTIAAVVRCNERALPMGM